MVKPFMTNNYYDLSYLIGEQLEILRGGMVLCQHRLPEKAEIIKDYGKTVLLEMTFIKSEWGAKYNIPRKIRKLIPKASMAVGDIIFKIKSSGVLQRSQIIRGNLLKDTFALVEYEDGCCENVYPWEIKFADGGEFAETIFLNDEQS